MFFNMTMFPAHPRNLINKNSYGTGYEYGGGCGYNYDWFVSLSGGGSDLMADQGESRTEISVYNDEETTGSTSKDDIIITNHHQEMINKEDDGEWLQLSLGSGRPVSRRPSLELDLLPAGGSGSTSSGGGETTLSLTLTAPPRQQQQHLSFQVPITTAAAAGSTFFLQPQSRGWAVAIDSAAPPISHQQYDSNYMAFRPASYPLLSMTTSFPAASGGGRPLDIDTGPPLRMDFRVVDPPPRPHSGVWFILQASQNQIKEPYLAQVPKSYLRIKDGRTTVRLLIKYLVDKLKLDSEFEIEITCKGQQLLPFLTLQHVRDNIWNSPRNGVVFPRSSTTIIDHLMVLNYGRIA